MRHLLLPAALFLPLAAPAGAATVTVGPNETLNEAIPEVTRDGVQVTAAAGETNDVTVSYDGVASRFPRTVTVRDASSPLTAVGPECTQVNANTVTCSRAEGLGATRVELGEGDDAVRLESSDSFSLAGLDADGGAGSDELIGAVTLDRLNGGGGLGDILRGGGNEGDELRDGDSDETADADIIDGDGDASLFFDNRRRPVTLRVNGKPAGEGDRITGVRAVYGGTGADRLFVGSTGQVNFELSGQAGDDRLELSTGYERRGLVLLRGDTGDDTMVGRKGAQSFEPGPGRDSIECGPSGGDQVAAPGERDVMRDCEEAQLIADRGDVEFDPTPSGRRSLTFRIGCLVFDPGNDEVEPFDTTCRGVVTVAQGRRTLGKARLRPSERRGTKPVRVRANRSLRSRTTRVTVRYRGGEKVTWLFRR